MTPPPSAATARRTPGSSRSRAVGVRTLGVALAATLAAVSLSACTGGGTSASSTGSSSVATDASSSGPTTSATGSGSPSTTASTGSGGPASPSGSGAASSGSSGSTAPSTSASPSATGNRCAQALPYDQNFIAAVNDYLGGVENTTTTIGRMQEISAGLSDAMKGVDLDNLSPQDKAIVSLGVQVAMYQRTLGQAEQRKGQALSAALVSSVAVQQACGVPRGRGCDAALATSYAGILAATTVTADSVVDYRVTIGNAALLAADAKGAETGAKETAIERNAAALAALAAAARKGDTTQLQTALTALQQARTGLEKACGATSASSAS